MRVLYFCVALRRPVKNWRAKAEREMSGSRYRAVTPSLFRVKPSATFTLFLRPLMTNVLFSPKLTTARAALR